MRLRRYKTDQHNTFHRMMKHKLCPSWDFKLAYWTSKKSAQAGRFQQLPKKAKEMHLQVDLRLWTWKMTSENANRVRFLNHLLVLLLYPHLYSFAEF